MKCKECGKKFSFFSAGVDGLDLCPECAKKIGRMGEQERRNRIQERIEAAREDRPPLRAQCAGGKSVSAQSGCIVVESEKRTTVYPIRAIQRVEFTNQTMDYTLDITSGTATESLTTGSEVEASFLSDILEYIINYGM